MTRNSLIRLCIVAISGTLSFDFGTPMLRCRSRLLAPAQPKRVSSNPNRPRHPQRTAVWTLSLLADVAPNEVPNIDAAVVVPQHEQMHLSRITVPADGPTRNTMVDGWIRIPSTSTLVISDESAAGVGDAAGSLVVYAWLGISVLAGLKEVYVRLQANEGPDDEKSDEERQDT
eukprot:CAMPEP_0194441660 /NCGR_PEP_ID=MMETSP0176-20130528/122653_1 /TAXON_ID=216777 /ORGANISM="Proboscia alata, Strain PI-D3" /LENGTH=172 /DNA_ID=CAMNT_0039267205 /DNA_START=56 /DNA_END=574 /DNA_ORIENTATION=+